MGNWSKFPKSDCIIKLTTSNLFCKNKRIITITVQCSNLNKFVTSLSRLTAQHDLIVNEWHNRSLPETKLLYVVTDVLYMRMREAS